MKLVQYSVTHFIQTSSQVTTLPRVTLGKGGDQLVEHITNPKISISISIIGEDNWIE